jgi:hypothetical protein
LRALAGPRGALTSGMFEAIPTDALAAITGGADIPDRKPFDPMGPTVLVAGRPQTQQALLYRRDRLFEHADDPKVSNEQFLRTYKKLNDAYMRLPYLR